MIECLTLYGEKKLVEAEKLEFRPAAYGIIVHEGNILLVNTKSTGKYFFPGGAIEKGERTTEALKREVKEEAGIDIDVKCLFEFHESFFYYDPWEKGFHSFAFIYTCEPKSFELSDVQNEKEDEAEKPRWVNMDSLKKEDFQSFAGEIFMKFKNQE